MIEVRRLLRVARLGIDPLNFVTASRHFDDRVELRAATEINGVDVAGLRQRAGDDTAWNAALDHRVVRRHRDERDGGHESLQVSKLTAQYRAAAAGRRA